MGGWVSSSQPTSPAPCARPTRSVAASPPRCACRCRAAGGRSASRRATTTPLSAWMTAASGSSAEGRRGSWAVAIARIDSRQVRRYVTYVTWIDSRRVRPSRRQRLASSRRASAGRSTRLDSVWAVSVWVGCRYSHTPHTRVSSTPLVTPPLLLPSAAPAHLPAEPVPLLDASAFANVAYASVAPAADGAPARAVGSAGLSVSLRSGGAAGSRDGTSGRAPVGPRNAWRFDPRNCSVEPDAGSAGGAEPRAETAGAPSPPARLQSAAAGAVGVSDPHTPSHLPAPAPPAPPRESEEPPPPPPSLYTPLTRVLSRW